MDFETYLSRLDAELVVSITKKGHYKVNDGYFLFHAGSPLKKIKVHGRKRVAYEFTYEKRSTLILSSDAVKISNFKAYVNIDQTLLI